MLDPEAEHDMVGSLRRYGQLAPQVVCRREETPEVLDGFKRLAAARVLGLTTLRARLLDADERTAKAALYGLNCAGQRPCDWEEAWIVHALVREDGLSQLEVADLLGRHKSWVCRRLALIEKLAAEAREDLRLGLLSVTAARSLVRLPAGNQPEVIAALRRHELTTAELDGVVELLQAAPGRAQEEYILAQPRQALQQAHHVGGWTHDPRLSRAGNRLARRLSQLLEGLLDLQSRNQTHVNGQLRQAADLAHGDRIKAGRTVFEVTIERPAGQASVEASPARGQTLDEPPAPEPPARASVTTEDPPPRCQTCRSSPATGWSASWAAAAWVSSTWLTVCLTTCRSL